MSDSLASIIQDELRQELQTVINPEHAASSCPKPVVKKCRELLHVFHQLREITIHYNGDLKLGLITQTRYTRFAVFRESVRQTAAVQQYHEQMTVDHRRVIPG